MGRRPAFEAIAVLPFDNLSPVADRQYVADGVTEALITNLGQASALRVIARTSVNQYKGTKKPIREIARELNVDVVVEGTITESGDRVRVTANLIQVSPERHIWARSYERNLRDLLTLQNKLAGAIASEVHGTLTAQQQLCLKKSRPVNPEMQMAYWRARYFLDGRRDAESARKSVEYAGQAVRIDPEHAPAQAALARAYLMLSNLGAAFPAELTQRAKAAVQRAIALDEDLAEAHVALSSILLAYGWDWVGAERAARRAISLNASDADAHLCLANYLAAVGRVDEAVVEIAGLAADLRVRADYDGFNAQSLEQLRAAYSQRGLHGHWTNVRELLIPRAAATAHGSYRLAEVDTYLGDTEAAFRGLEQAYQARSGFMPWIKVDSSLDPLRADPRFSKLLRRMGLPPV